ncbi:L-gulono-1,4-lactone dehydrogenase-like [Asterias amurensis]|uniref:L-gulono-1,4-lactone dehydrogenase-like n=1 Tax=Asterias amurensis TaxID=7602 RepID=UPI003AB181EC
MLKSLYQGLANACSMVDCCFGMRPCHQAVFPCIRSCSYGDRKVFYNYDGTETVEPLVDYFKPTNSLLKRNMIRGMKLDKAELKRGLDAVQQIAAVVHFAHQNDLKVRAVGTGSSWSKLTNVRDILIDMTALNQIIRVDKQDEEGALYHIEVQGGMKLHDFVRIIDEDYGMSLPCMGNYAGQTIAGIISTSTHGTGQDYPTMSNFVAELHMIICGGVQVRVRIPREGETDEDFDTVRQRIESAEYGDPFLDIHSTDVFRAAAVGFGSLGVIYSVTLTCVPVYNIRETRHYIEMDWPESTPCSSRPVTRAPSRNNSNLDISSTNSSLEESTTRLEEESESIKAQQPFTIPETVKNMSAGQGKYFSFFVNPFPRKSHEDPDRTVLKSVYLSGERTEETGSCQCDCCLNFQCCACTGCRGQSACQIVQTDCSASCLQLGAHCLPSFIPWFADCGLHQFARDAPYIQKWYNVLTFTNGNLHIKTAEYCIPLQDLDAALADIVRVLQEYGKLYQTYTLLPIYVRMVKADDLYMSPANRHTPDGGICERYCYIEVPFLPGAYGIDEFHKKLEDFLFGKYRARPHWSKNNFLSYNRVERLYPHLDKWRRVYVLFNRDGTFDNEFTRKCGFDDFHLRDREEEEVEGARGVRSSPTANNEQRREGSPERSPRPGSDDCPHPGTAELGEGCRCSGSVTVSDVIVSQPARSTGVSLVPEHSNITVELTDTVSSHPPSDVTR